MKVQPTTQQLIAMLYERLPELFDRPQRQRSVKPLTQDMVESCPYHGETLRGAFFDGWIKSEAAHGIYAPTELKENT